MIAVLQRNTSWVRCGGGGGVVTGDTLGPGAVSVFAL